MQTKLSLFFSAPLWSFLQIFAKRVYDPNFACFLVISTLIFCSLRLLFFMFCVSFFRGGLPHRKGVCKLDIVYCINHFNSKWRVKYLALFVVGAASLRPSVCKQNILGGVLILNELDPCWVFSCLFLFLGGL